MADKGQTLGSFGSSILRQARYSAVVTIGRLRFVTREHQNLKACTLLSSASLEVVKAFRSALVALLAKSQRDLRWI